MAEYSKERLQIVPYIDNKGKLFVRKLKELGIDIPLELVGNSINCISTGQTKIYYPLGDIFASVATLIHELGHLRLDEINPEFAMKLKSTDGVKYYELTNPSASESLENTAWYLGWQRFSNYASDAWIYLEEAFASHKVKGRLNRFDNFQGFYFHWYEMIFQRLNQKILPIKIKTYPEDPEIIRKTANIILNDNKLHEFLHKPFYWQSGENADEEFMESLIFRIFACIIKENYN